MNVLIKPSFKAWPLWGQVITVFLLASILFGAIAGKIVNQMETRHLYENHLLFTKKIFDTIISGSIEAIITEDRPILNTIVSELVAASKEIYYLSIHNEDGDILAEWKKNSHIRKEELLPFSENVFYEGEIFGYIEIVWDTRILKQDLSDHVFSIQSFVVLTILLLAIVILAWLYFVVIKPMSRLIHRLDPENFNRMERISLSEFLPIEFKRLHMTIDKLKEVSISREELTREVITRKKAEHAAELARDEAVQANNVKSLFLANISHELRTPLNAIIGYSDLLIIEAKNRCDDKSLESLSTIKMSGKYLLEIINSILDFSKIEADKIQLHLSEVDINYLINEVKMISLPMIERNKNKLQIFISDEVSSIVSDSMRTRQILLNILSNSAKFTNEGVISVQVTKVDECVQFSISDTGIGMTQDELDNLFVPFMQGDNSSTREYQGTGLGLAITMRLVELLDGTITVSSEKNVGSKFVVTLPQVISSESHLSHKQSL